MDYLKAVQIPTQEVQLAGAVVRVTRCPLLTHIRLRNIGIRLAASDPGERIDAVFDYLSLASGIEDLSRVEVAELAPALDVVFNLNSTRKLLPWQEVRHSDVSTSSADYDNRELAIIVNMLAISYGWSEEEIHELQPEVASCYVQEVMISDWRQKEFNYSLSELAYDAKTGKYNPFQPLPWLHEQKGPSIEEATAKVPSRFVPSGVVIDLSKGLRHVEKEKDHSGEAEDQD